MEQDLTALFSLQALLATPQSRNQTIARRRPWQPKCTLMHERWATARSLRFCHHHTAYTRHTHRHSAVVRAAWHAILQQANSRAPREVKSQQSYMGQAFSAYNSLGAAADLLPPMLPCMLTRHSRSMRSRPVIFS